MSLMVVEESLEGVEGSWRSSGRRLLQEVVQG